ncbi:phosphotransferase [Edaphobacillus lindanitolerans]|uniref:Phosphotransferase enzyme family protein n=1 Tax=Edaphobacillus lindanitolerans TaxID=550447 RepID=A0A1U7PN10_9BACI|nr:phosphotransferase [Edaphobacillus lindanitolerans]SIT82967.1 Phosphotransferase enzyme family protein [Edaphobacillus lindanitolerans]
MAAGGNFRQIKPNVWKWDVAGKGYSLKKYDSYEVAAKVRRIHTELGKVGFPHILPVVGAADERTVIQPWLENARPADYSTRNGRARTLAVLKALHATSAVVDWQSVPGLRSYPLIAKWEDRLDRFRSRRKELEPYIGSSAFETTVFHAEEALKTIRKSYEPEEGCTLLHGDVVHHNFLKGKDGRYVLIDFDLACTGPPGTETALWMHRVLPHVGYDFDYLAGERPSLARLSRSSLDLILYPNEVLREWLYLLSLDEEKRPILAGRLIQYTEKALSRWIPLCFQVTQAGK